MNRGFTLVELLTVIVLIAIVSGLAVFGYQRLFGNAEDHYYSALEKNIMLAGSDYYVDHRDKLPVADETREITLGDLVDSRYINPIMDSNGNSCDKGKVYAYRENNRYVYEVCLECDNYQSEGKKCQKYALSK